MTYRNLWLIVLLVTVFLALPFTAFAQEDAHSPAARIQRLIEEGFNQGTINVVDELFAENYIVHPSEGNREAFKESAIALRGMFPDIHAQADQIVSQANWASFHFTLTGTFANAYVTSQGSLPPTNQFTTIDMNVFLRYDDQGKVVEEWDYIDNYGFLTQIGVIESMSIGYTPTYSTSKGDTLAKRADVLTDTADDIALNNKALVQHIFDDIINMHNLSSTEAIFAPDFTYHGVTGSTSLSAWKSLLDGMFNAMPDLQITPEIMIAEGNLVSVRYLLRGTFMNPLVTPDGSTVTPNARYIELPGSMVIRFDESGKVVETHEIFDNLSLLTQLGIFSW